MPNYIISPTSFLIVFAVAIFMSLFFNNFLVKRSSKILIKKANAQAVRFSSQTKSILGGVGLFALFIMIMIYGFFTVPHDCFASKNIALLIAVIISFAMGLADDTLNTSPFFKFIVQVIVAAIFIVSDIYIVISPYTWLNYMITVFWIVGIMNSINMIDNMDAIASSICLSIFGGIACYTFLFGNGYGIDNLFDVWILFILIAGLIGFLFYNRPPAKMYLGDNGSQFLGVMLAYFGIIFFWKPIHTDNQYAYNTLQFLIVILAFIVPLCDTTTVTINRLLKGKSPFVGDKNHTNHHLFYLGIPVKWIGIFIFCLNSIGVILALYLIHNQQNIDYSNIWIIVTFPIITFLFLYLNTKLTKEK